MPIYKINGQNPWTAIKNEADKLTPEEFDFCVHEDPWTAVKYCAKKLNNEQKRYETACAIIVDRNSVCMGN